MLLSCPGAHAEEGLLGSILPPEPYEAAGLEPDPEWAEAWPVSAPAPVTAPASDSATLIVAAPTDTAPRHRDAGRPFSRTLLVIQGLEKFGEFLPLVNGPAGLLRRYYDATHTDRYSLDINANPLRDNYSAAVKVKF